MSDHACAMRGNDRRGRGVESARHDGQAIGFVSMMPVQARMPVDEFESVRPLRMALVRAEVVAIDKCPQRFGSEKKSARKRAGIVRRGRHERRSGRIRNRAAIGWKSGQSKREQNQHERAHASMVQRFITGQALAFTWNPASGRRSTTESVLSRRGDGAWRDGGRFADHPLRAAVGGCKGVYSPQ